MEETALTTAEAVLLAHGLVQRLAESVGARVLFVKGPTAVAVGARPPRPSSDVDVLVDPASFETLCEAIEGLGWIRRHAPMPVPRAADLAFDHSAHFIHEQWPCDVDLHFSFPGFFADASSVFDALWAVRTDVVVASVPVSAPDLIGQALVVGLHALRNPDAPSSRDDLDHLKGVMWTLMDQPARQALGALAAATGSEHSGRPLLALADVDVTTAVHHPRELRAWRLFQRYSTVSGSIRLVDLTRAPWRERPRVVAAAILPPREVLLSSHLAATATSGELARLHIQRWGRGLRAMPRALRILGQLRGSADR